MTVNVCKAAAISIIQLVKTASDNFPESNMTYLKSPSGWKCVLFHVTSLGCLSFTVQKNARAEFDTSQLKEESFSESSLNLDNTWMWQHSQSWSSIQPYISVIWLF